MPKVLISDALSPAAVQIFKDRGIEVDFQPSLGKDKEKLAELVGNYDGLAIRSATKVTPKILEKANNLKVIGRAGIGVDNVDIPAATAKGIIVMNTPFGNSITTAEHAISLMLALARQIPEADASTRAGKWEKNKFMGREVSGKTVGIVGEYLTLDQMSEKLSKGLNIVVKYQAVEADAYRRFGFPGADELGNMFQVYRDFEKQVLGARSIDVTRSLNPSLQTFDQWLARNKNLIPLE